jgi:large subunit ribosomal protein L5
MARLKDRYNEEIRAALMRRFEYSSIMEAPRLTKITLNMGVGEAKQDNRMLEAAREQLATIAGQQPNIRRARKSVAAFKLREGMPVGLTVTLRQERAYEFLDRLTAVAIPRIRDFRGLSPRSTAAATTRWASASRSSSRRSTTTPSTRSGAWT